MLHIRASNCTKALLINSRNIKNTALPFHNPTWRGHTISCASFLNSMSSSISIDHLQDKWNLLYRTRLPSLAKAKDPAQPKWPVKLDHCFARIVLDNAIGKDRPWHQVVKSPAYKNMSRQQLEDAIELGEKLASGEENLVELDEKSLALRGKRSKLQGKEIPATKKRKVEKEDDGGRDLESEQKDGDQQRARKKRATEAVKASHPKRRS